MRKVCLLPMRTQILTYRFVDVMSVTPQLLSPYLDIAGVVLSCQVLLPTSLARTSLLSMSPAVQC